VQSPSTIRLAAGGLLPFAHPAAQRASAAAIATRARASHPRKRAADARAGSTGSTPRKPRPSSERVAGGGANCWRSSR